MNSQQARKPPFEAYKGIEPYVFISYAHSDGDAVFEHLEQLRSRGVRIWYDEGIDPGNEWPEEIARALDRCALFIFFVSPRSVVSKNCRDEVNFALNASKPFLAVHMEETTLPVGLSLRMGSIQAIMYYRMPEESYWRKVLKVLDPFRVREGAAATDAYEQGMHMPQVPPDEFGSGRLPAPPASGDTLPRQWDENVMQSAGNAASPALPVAPGSAGLAGVSSGHYAGASPYIGQQPGQPGYNQYSPAVGSPGLPGQGSGSMPYAQPQYGQPGYGASPAVGANTESYKTGTTSSGGLQPATVVKIMLGLAAAFFMFMLMIAAGALLYWQPWNNNVVIKQDDGGKDDKREPVVVTNGKEVRIEKLGFVYMVPDSWQVKTDTSISKYELALGPKFDDFTNNINVVDEDFNGTIDEYVEANMRTLRKEFKNLSIVSSSAFSIDDGPECRRVITEHNTFSDRYLRQTFYFFKPRANNTWVVLTTSASRSAGQDSQPLFDGIVKTVRIIGSGKSNSTSTGNNKNNESSQPSSPTIPALSKKLDGGSFTFMLPDSWELRTDKEKSKFPTAFGPKVDDFTCNLNIVDEEYSGDLKEYVDANMRTLNKDFKNMKVVSNASFTTTRGLPGWRVITEHNTFGRDLRQCFYFFKSTGNTYLVVTSTAPQKVGPDMQPLFDAILKTFVLSSGSSSSNSNTPPTPPAPPSEEPRPASTLPALTQEVRSTAGNFIYKIPEDWSSKLDTSRSQYPITYGPASGDFTANINAVNEAYKGSLPDYVNANIKSLKDFKNFKIVENGKFVTDGGLEGVRLITEHNNFNNRFLRQTFYFLRSNKPGEFLILTSSSSMNAAVDLQPIFDAILRSFRFTSSSTSPAPSPAPGIKDEDDDDDTVTNGKAVKLDSLGLTYMVPQTWSVTTDTNLSKYPIAKGPTSDNFTANLNSVDEDFTGSVDEYVEANMRTLRKEFKNLTVVQSGRFTTQSGIEGRRVITEHNTFQSRYLRQTFYFFKAKGRTWVVLTSSTTQKNGPDLQPVFDSIMRSLRRL